MFVTGRLAVLALLFIPVVGAVPRWSTIGIGALLLVGIVVTDVALAGSTRRLVVTRSGATRVRLGEVAVLHLHVTNQGSRALRLLIRDAWLPSAGAPSARQAVTLTRGGSADLTRQLMPIRRGDHRPDRITIRSHGPLRVAGRQTAHRSPWTLRALPAFASRRHLPSRLARLQELDGRTPVMVRGAGTEFDTLRPYVDGDDIRSIDWRATARAPEVMVRTWRPERDRRVLIVVDSGRTAAARVGDAPRLDSAMDAALLLAALAGRAGDHVSLLVHDSRPRAWVGGAEGADMLPSMVEALAGIEPALVETDARAMVAQVLARQRQRALVVLLTALDPVSLSQGLLPVLPQLVAKHQVVIASVADPQLASMVDARGDVDAVYAAASAELANRERRVLTDLLSRRSVEVVEAPPERIAPALADRYIALKAAGRL